MTVFKRIQDSKIEIPTHKGENSCKCTELSLKLNEGIYGNNTNVWVDINFAHDMLNVKNKKADSIVWVFMFNKCVY